jgi:polyphosphate kinase
MDSANKNPRDMFIHRDLSWLSFNERVLDEAADRSTPLMERLRFLSICANNLDEFCMVRVAGHKRLIDAGYNHRDDFGFYPMELYEQIHARIVSFMTRMYDLYRGEIVQELRKNGIVICAYAELTPERRKSAKKYFDTTLLPVITPMAVDQAHPFPVLFSKTTAFAVYLNREDVSGMAIVTIPRSVPRFFKLPSEKGEFCFIRIDEIIRHNLESFFRGYKLMGSFAFRFVRDSEIASGEEFSTDLRKAIEGELKKRPTARVVSLQVEKEHLPALLYLLYTGIDFPKEKILFVNSDLDLGCLAEIPSHVARPDLFFPSYVPVRTVYDNIFDRIKENDLMLHLPYQSFHPTVDLIQAAAADPDVLAIKLTLYRTNEDSAIIAALIRAAKSNKQVTVLVEIKARFDEERNIGWTKELEAGGCHVIYGMPGMKVHSKITLIVRKEEARIRRYVHISTGNYNEKTARIYTDIGYFTANEDVARDISDVFNVLTGYSLPGRWRRIVSSPNDLRQYLYEMIDREIECQRQYGSGVIMAKMNSLEDIPMINKLYEASAAGVKVRLIVRGICCLVPGRKGLSEHIKVKSIVGRFLEHSRIFFFNNNGEQRTFLASADWMGRNFDRRIELLFEVNRPEDKDHLKWILDMSWKDNVKSRVLGPDGAYLRAVSDASRLNVQEHMIQYYTK